MKREAPTPNGSPGKGVGGMLCVPPSEGGGSNPVKDQES